MAGAMFFGIVLLFPRSQLVIYLRVRVNVCLSPGKMFVQPQKVIA